MISLRRGCVFATVSFICPPHMAPIQKREKKLSSSTKKLEASGAIPWPDFPQQLLNLIGKQLNLLTNIGWGGITKSWRAVPRHCSSAAKAPWLQLSDANENNRARQHRSKTQPHFLNIPDYPGCYIWRGRRRSPENWMHFLGCSHGLVVTATDDPHYFYLSIPLWGQSYIPPWDAKIPFKFGTLSSTYSYLHDSSMMVLTGISSPAFMISKLGKRTEWKWIRHDCTLVDPYDSEKQPMKFTNAIGSKGKFYALSLLGTLALIEEVDSQFRITGIGKNRAVPSVSSRHFVEYLIESNGEILLVFLISKKSIHKVDDIEVFQLDLSRLSWVKMESLGDRTLFLGTNCCISITASQVGCKSNRVYFSRHPHDDWQEYDMAVGSISPCCNNLGSKMKFPAWDVPVDDEGLLI